MLRSEYSGSILPAARRLTCFVAVPLLLAGCSFSLFGSPEAPVTTGSIAPAVEVRRPLPPTLAYSDASKIGQAAAAVLWQAGEGGPTEWVNAATGSSGTVEQETGARGENLAHCRPFSTIVTSIAGVHRYSGDICQSENGRSVLRIDEGTAKART